MSRHNGVARAGSVAVAALLCMVATMFAMGSSAALGATPLAPVASNNAWDNNYSLNWASVEASSLNVAPSGNLERSEYVSGTGLVVEEYDPASYQLVSQRVIDADTYTPADLPEGGSLLWGGLLQGEDSNFVVTGQPNLEENDSLTVVQVTKYTKAWEYVGKLELKSINTYVPFDAGSCRMVEVGGKLWIRTCHEMYLSSDNKHHQACMTFVVDEDSLACVDSLFSVALSPLGYVSHSFNQHLAVLGQDVYALDHGDAYPRSAVIEKLGVTGSSVEVLAFSGDVGDNFTYATTGGLAASEASDTLLAVGSSADQSQVGSSVSTNLTLPRNVWLSVTDASTLETTVYWLTNYEDGSQLQAGNPQLVKVSDDKFLVMWGTTALGLNGARGTTVTYQFFDGKGNALTEAAITRGMLSDCQPVAVDDKVIWYATGKPLMYADVTTSFSSSTPVFQAIDANTYEPVQINPFAFADITLEQDSYTYTGSALEPSATVVVNGETLVQGADYTLVYQDNVNVGTATVQIVGMGRYEGCNSEATFTIGRASITTAVVSFEWVQTYIGAPVTPRVAVTFGGTVLQEGVDYTVGYENNVSVGTGMLWVYGTGNFVDGQGSSFTIRPAVLTATYASETVSCVDTPSLQVQVTGFVEGESAEDAAGYVAPQVTLPTDFAARTSLELTPAGGMADNYVFQYVSGTLTIEHEPGEVVIENEVAATYAKTGSYDEAVYCKACGTELSRKTVIVPQLERPNADSNITSDGSNAQTPDENDVPGIDAPGDGSDVGLGTAPSNAPSTGSAPGAPKVTSVTVGGVTYTISGKVAKVTKVAKSKKSVTIKKSVKINGKTYKVSKVAAKVFKGTKVTKLTIKSTTLTKKGVKSCLKGSKVKTVKVPKAKRAAYKKLFKKAVCGKKVTVK